MTASNRALRGIAALLALASLASLSWYCQRPVAPPPAVAGPPLREPTLEDRRKHCESMGQEFATGYVYTLDLSRSDAAPERIATVPGAIRLAEGLVVFDDGMVVGGYKGLTWFGRDGSARFLSAPDDGYTLQLMPFDMDGDGDLDLIVVHEHSVVDKASNTSSSFARPVVWLREGDTFQRSRVLSTGGYAGIHELMFVDIEGSSAPELLYRSAREFQVLRALRGKEVRVSLAKLPTNLQYLSTATADVNGDGLRDLVALGARTDGVEHNVVHVNFARPGGGYGESVDSALNAFFGRASDFTDVTGDGVPDLALTRLDAANTFAVDLWLGHRDGTFSEPRRIAGGLDQEPDLLSFDVDGDGARELVMWSGKLSVASVKGGEPTLLLERVDVPYGTAKQIRRSPRTGGASLYWIVPGCDGSMVM